MRHGSDQATFPSGRTPSRLQRFHIEWEERAGAARLMRSRAPAMLPSGSVIVPEPESLPSGATQIARPAATTPPMPCRERGGPRYGNRRSSPHIPSSPLDVMPDDRA